MWTNAFKMEIQYQEGCNSVTDDWTRNSKPHSYHLKKTGKISKEMVKGSRRAAGTSFSNKNLKTTKAITQMIESEIPKYMHIFISLQENLQKLNV